MRFCGVWAGINSHLLAYIYLVTDIAAPTQLGSVVW